MANSKEVRLASSHSMSRRDFFKVGGTGLAGTTGLLITAGCGGGGGGQSNGNGGKKGGGGGKSYSFRLADDQPKDYPTVIGDKKFADLVEQRTNGRIKIKVFPGAQLGEEAEVLGQVQSGAIHFTRVNASPLAEFAKDLGVFSLPYLFNDSQHLWTFLKSDTGEKLLTTLQSARMNGLAYYDSGQRSFYTTKKIVKKPEDMKGLKIRVQKSKITTQLMNALGASATPMDFSEVYTGLQNGVVDGAENNWPSYYTTKHYEVAPNYTLDMHTRVPEVLLVSKSTWDQLSSDDQKIVKKAAEDSVPAQRQAWDKLVKESQKKIKAAGNNIIQVDHGPWKEAVSSMIDSYSNQYGKYLDAINAAAK